MLTVGPIPNVSVGGMFLGALPPAAVMALCLMALIYLRARASGTPRNPRAGAGVVARAGLGAILPLLMPGTLLAGILLGVATPTRIAALAVVYGILLSALALREMDLPGFLRLPIHTPPLSSALLFFF